MTTSLITRALRGERKSVAVGYPAPGWPPAPGYFPRTAGVTVSTDSVLGTAAAWASVTLIARAIARLPLFLYRTDGDAKTVDKAHQLYRLLHDQPNEYMTSFTWRSVMAGHLETWGNAYAEIERDGFDRIVGIHPRRPDFWRIDWEAGRKVFYYQQPDGSREAKLTADRVLHIPGFGSDGLTGYSPVAMHRRSFALGIAATEYGTRVFANDARPGIALQFPKALPDAAIRRLTDDFMLNHTGPENAGRPAFLEEGMTLTEFGFPPEDAQYLDTRKFQRDETDDIFGIPVGFRSSADENMAVKFVVYTLGPRLVMIEQELKRQLIGAEDVFAEFAVEGLLRGNSGARAAFYASGLTNGWLNVDTVRGWENLPPLPNDAGQGYMKPLNMGTVGGSEGSVNRNPSPSTGNPDSPGAAVPLDTLPPLVASQPSRNGRAHAEVI